MNLPPVRPLENNSGTGRRFHSLRDAPHGHQGWPARVVTIDTPRQNIQLRMKGGPGESVVIRGRLVSS